MTNIEAREVVNTWINIHKKVGKLNKKAVESLSQYAPSILERSSWKNRPKNAKKISWHEYHDLICKHSAFLTACSVLKKERPNQKKRSPIDTWSRDNYISFFGRVPYRKNKHINDGLFTPEHLAKVRTARIKSFLISNLELYPSGSCSVNVTTGAPNYDCESSKGDKYTKRDWYRKTDIAVNISVCPGYLTMIRNGTAIMDGLVNLYLAPVVNDTDNNITLYMATWLERSRGFNYNVKQGYIATQDNVFYHGKTKKSALLGLQRKIENRPVNETNRILALAKDSDLFLSFNDSVKSGNCESGTADFCNRHDIDPASVIPLSAAAALYEKTYNTGLLRAINFVLKKEGKKQ